MIPLGGNDGWNEVNEQAEQEKRHQHAQVLNWMHG
jgi:hypothetical protein